jgi:6-phosphogluconolactonase
MLRIWGGNTLSGLSGGTAVPGSPYATGTGPNSVNVDPLDNFVYVTNEGSDNISAYSLGANGALTPIAGSPFPAGDEPSAVAMDPSGRFVYVVNSSSGTVSVFAIAGSTGSLSAASGSPYAAGNLPSAIAISD